jgi:nucleotide-binding universal stress UspA family protein
VDAALTGHLLSLPTARVHYEREPFEEDTMNRRRFDVIVGTDATEEARAAVKAMGDFPWPAGTTVKPVVACRTAESRGWPEYVKAAFDRSYAQAGLAAQRLLERRWPGTTFALVDESPANAILGEARRRRSRVIVLGSRNRGWVARRLLGSVAAAVTRHAPCAVLVIRGRPRRFARIMIGVDGSRHARHAVDFVKRLPPPRTGAVTVVRAVEPYRTPSMPFMPSRARTMLARQSARLDAVSVRAARTELARHERVLRRAGWKARAAIVRDYPLQGVLSAAARARADLLVIGARGIGGIERLLLGSVAEAILDRAPISVLVVR